jgi:hypothetical protein
MWRVYIKDRTKPLYSKENDQTIVRHLHDIAALEDLLYTKEFVELLLFRVFLFLLNLLCANVNFTCTNNFPFTNNFHCFGC